MGLRDRFYTPATAKALLSWRLLLGLGVGVGVSLIGAPIGVGVAAGIAVYAASVYRAMPPRRRRANIDPFVLGEPWRQLMQRAQGAERRLRSTIEGMDDGPLRQTLHSVADQLAHGLDEAWEVARRGDEIDDAVRRLDPTALRSRLSSLQQRAGASPSDETDAAIASVERQIESADRLRRQSADTATSLRLTQTRLDELVARANEVRIGAVDTVTYRRDVDDLVVKLEALHQAVEETGTA